jgi:hypothetical protein
MLYILIGSLLGSIGIVWSLPLIALKVFGVSLYVINDKRKFDSVLKKLNDKVVSSMFKYQYGECKNNGIIFSRFCIGFIFEKVEERQKIQELYILLSKKRYDTLIKDDEENDIETGKFSIVIGTDIERYDREGNYFRLYYTPRKILFVNDPTEIQRYSQENIVSRIIEFYNTKKRCTAFIHGLPGSGKTTIAYLLATELNGTLCKTFNPIEPGDTLSNLIDRVKPNKMKPLIILMDEINTTIRKIHNQSIDPHKDIPIPVFDKTTFNGFLDDMKYNPYIILLLTSNESKEAIDLLDKSYIREGRVNEYFTMN